MSGEILGTPIETTGYVPRPAEIDEPIVLTPDSKMAATDRRWLQAVDGRYPSMVMLDSGDEALSPEQIVAMLDQDPALIHSFDVLDDISESLDTLMDEWGELCCVLSMSEESGSADSALANVTLLDPNERNYQMNREQCLEQTVELVKLAMLASRALR